MAVLCRAENIVSISFNVISIVLLSISFVLLYLKIFHYIAIRAVKNKKELLTFNKIVVNLTTIALCIVLILCFYYAVSKYDTPDYLKEGITSVVSALIGGIAADTLMHIRNP